MTSPNGFTKTMVQKSALAMLLLPGIACSQAKQAAAPSGPAAAAASEAPQDLPETESVHILTGRSVVINLQTKVKRIYVSNPAVLESVTSSPLQVVLTAKAPGSCNVMLWDVDGHTRLLDVTADIDVDGLRNALQQQFPNQQIDVHAEEDKVILTGTAADQNTADAMVKLAGAYSKSVVGALDVAPAPRPKQVMLKVRFAEVDRTRLASFGVNLLSTGAGNTIGTTSTQQFSAPTTGVLTGAIGQTNQGYTSNYSLNSLLNIFLYRPDLNFGMLLQDLQQHNVLQLLAEPNLMAISGTQAHFLAGGEFPYPVVQGGTAGVTPAVTIQFRPYGVKLDFTAVVEPDNTIRIHMAPEVSSLDYSNSVTISGFTIPALSTRRTETDIQLKDGQSFGIAGLLDKTTTEQLSKVPGIGDVPILGQLFRSKNMNLSNSELLILVTPTILDPADGNVKSAAEPKLAAPMLSSDTFDNENKDKK